MTKIKNTEVASIAPPEQTKDIASVESFILKAIETNVPVETMEKLFALREKVKAEKAKEVFVQSMSNFQNDCPIIKKTKKILNKDGRTTRYMYAPLEAIVEQIKAPLAKNGLSYTWDVTNATGLLTAIAKVTHILGHSEVSSFQVPIDTEGYMTAPQKVASALTFAKRYSLCNALGISTGDEDTDATDVGKEKTPISPKAKIVFLLKTLGQKVDTAQNTAEAVVKLTKLNLIEKNFLGIVDRLEVLVTEQNEDPTIR